jgi:hypothetical protein
MKRFTTEALDLAPLNLETLAAGFQETAADPVWTAARGRLEETMMLAAQAQPAAPPSPAWEPPPPR